MEEKYPGYSRLSEQFFANSRGRGSFAQRVNYLKIAGEGCSGFATDDSAPTRVTGTGKGYEGMSLCGSIYVG
jgi:hypothetical protein